VEMAVNVINDLALVEVTVYQNSRSGIPHDNCKQMGRLPSRARQQAGSCILNGSETRLGERDHRYS
jgi:hypothetical protein